MPFGFPKDARWNEAQSSSGWRSAKMPASSGLAARIPTVGRRKYMIPTMIRLNEGNSRRPNRVKSQEM